MTYWQLKKGKELLRAKWNNLFVRHHLKLKNIVFTRTLRYQEMFTLYKYYCKQKLNSDEETQRYM